MTLTVNGYSFPDARIIEPSTSWGELRYSLHKRKPYVSRNSIDNHTLAISFILKGPNCTSQRELLQGLMQQGQVVIISSTTQKFWGQSYHVICMCLGVSFTEETPTYWTANATFEYRGIPSTTQTVYDVSSIQDFNDYDIAGQTTIGLPIGVSYVTDPGDGTNFAVTTRGDDPIVTGYDGLDSGSYVEDELMQTSIAFRYDPLQGHLNAVKVFDGTDEVTNADHNFLDVWTIENGQMRVVANLTDFTFEVRDLDDNVQEEFEIDGDFDSGNAKMLTWSSEYVALLVDNILVLELFRGRDLIVHVLDGTFKYVNSAGGAQESTPSDNALELGSSGVYVSSNGFFKTTANKEIMLQVGGDTNPSSLTTPPRYQIFVPDGDLATRKLEVLKRQA